MKEEMNKVREEKERANTPKKNTRKFQMQNMKNVLVIKFNYYIDFFFLHCRSVTNDEKIFKLQFRYSTHLLNLSV